MKYFTLFLLVILCSCKSDTSDNTMYVEGDIIELRKGTLYLQKIKDSLLINVDSLQLNRNGKFNFEVEISEPEIFHLYLAKDDGDSLNDRIIFFGDKGRINIKTRLKTFESSAFIQGSTNNDLLEEYKSISRKFNLKNLELFKLYLESQKDQNSKSIDSFKKQIDNLTKRKYLYTLNFANTHFDKMISPYIIISEASDANPNLLDTIAKKMPDHIKSSKYGKAFFEVLKKNKNIVEKK
ncbi:MAG: hypothetical protein CMC04_02485 [Flavobacteriaceae bacterium]|nr:hypothetical protein [Flavobacteriaceae bacterium]